MSEHALDQIVAGVDVSTSRLEYTLLGWPRVGSPIFIRIGGEPIPYLAPDDWVIGKPVMLGHKERHLDVRRCRWGTAIITRTTRRAARRARGRRRAPRRALRLARREWYRHLT